MSPSKRAFSMVELLVVVGIISLLIAILLPSLSRAREQASRSRCAANLHGLAQAALVYFTENGGRYPRHYVEPKFETDPNAVAAEITWVQTMASTDEVRLSRETSHDYSPRLSHPSRSLFLMIIDELAEPEQFVCSSTKDEPDDLRNHGGDCASAAAACRTKPGEDRFDFRGLTYLSYGYQMPYGPHATLQANSDPMTPMFADRSPYAKPLDARGETRTDRPEPMTGQGPVGLDIVQNWGRQDWAIYNSPNHGGLGQNVAYVDGHVAFTGTPLVGLEEDNIYSIQSDLTVVKSQADMGRRPDNRTFTPRSDTDTLIVP